MRTVRCNTCLGTGRFADQTVDGITTRGQRCTACDGSGQVPVDIVGERLLRCDDEVRTRVRAEYATKRSTSVDDYPGAVDDLLAAMWAAHRADSRMRATHGRGGNAIDEQSMLRVFRALARARVASMITRHR